MERRTFMNNASLVASNGVLLKPTPAGGLPIPLRDSITVELETGRVVEMVVGELSMLYEMGEVPDDLSSIAARELYPPASENPQERIKRNRERLRIAKWLVARVLRNPVVVEKPEAAHEIAIDHLYHDEIWEIWTLANSPARAMDNFRRQQARHVGAVSGLQDVGAATEPTAARAAAAE